jgi:hypothetical protein
MVTASTSSVRSLTDDFTLRPLPRTGTGLGCHWPKARAPSSTEGTEGLSAVPPLFGRARDQPASATLVGVGPRTATRRQLPLTVEPPAGTTPGMPASARPRSRRRACGPVWRCVSQVHSAPTWRLAHTAPSSLTLARGLLVLFADFLCSADNIPWASRAVNVERQVALTKAGGAGIVSRVASRRGRAREGGRGPRRRAWAFVWPPSRS